MTIDPAFEIHLADLALQARLWSAGALLAALLLLRLALRSGHKRAKHEGNQFSYTLCMQRLKAVHKGDSAIASLEFLMVFLPFLIIVMTVWQFAFMFNAQIHVGYAAYAAARSAAVMIPADLKDEKEGEMKKLKTKGAEKWESIRAAAIPGVLPISPGNYDDALLVWGSAKATHKKESNFGISTNLGAGAARLGATALHYMSLDPLKGNRFQRGLAKDWYAQSTTEVIINGSNHKKKLSFKETDDKQPETIKVTVKYPFWLNVPYVGRLVGALNGVKGGTFNPYPTVLLSETIHMKLWLRKRAMKPCND